jgi:hypothetical protein
MKPVLSDGLRPGEARGCPLGVLRGWARPLSAVVEEPAPCAYRFATTAFAGPLVLVVGHDRIGKNRPNLNLCSRAFELLKPSVFPAPPEAEMPTRNHLLSPILEVHLIRMLFNLVLAVKTSYHIRRSRA